MSIRLKLRMPYRYENQTMRAVLLLIHCSYWMSILLETSSPWAAQSCACLQRLLPSRQTSKLYVLKSWLSSVPELQPGSSGTKSLYVALKPLSVRLLKI